MATAGLANIKNARTIYETVVDSALDRARASAVGLRLARRRDGLNGLAVEFSLTGATPSIQRWKGMKKWRNFRHLSKTVTFDKHDASFKLFRSQVVHDPAGTTAQAIKRHASQTEYIWDQIVIRDGLASNPTGIDGVALVSDSHPFGEDGGTWDNKSANALSFREFKVARAAMRNLSDEYGIPFDLKPDTLIVNPEEEQIGLEIMQATDRPIAVGTAGAIDSGGIGATNITNVFRGTVGTLIVTQYMTAGDWLAWDSRFPPMALGVWRDPEVIVADDMAAKDRMDGDQFLYSLEVDANADGLEPYGLYGKLS